MQTVKSECIADYILNNHDEAIIDNAMEIIKSRLRKTSHLGNAPDLLAKHFNLLIGSSEREHFAVALFDSQLMLIECEVMFSGTVNKCSVWNREIIKRALALNASRVVISHNHPSGELTPSTADKKLTKELKQALGMLDIELVDHIIVGFGNFNSMRLNGEF